MSFLTVPVAASFFVGFLAAYMLFQLLYIAGYPFEYCRSEGFLQRTFNKVKARVVPDLLLEEFFHRIKIISILEDLFKEDFQALPSLLVCSHRAYSFDQDTVEVAKHFVKSVHLLFYSFPDDRRIGQRDPAEVLDEFTGNLCEFIRPVVVVEFAEMVGNSAKYVLARFDAVGKEQLQELVVQSPFVSDRVRNLVYQEHQDGGDGSRKDGNP